MTGTVTSLLDQGLSVASDTVRSSTAVVSTEANKAATQAKVGSGLGWPVADPMLG